MKRVVPAIGIISSIILISTLHFLTPVGNLILHQIYQRLYYIPIILAALRFGWRGGLGAALLAFLSYLPHIILNWQSQNYDYALNQYAEIAMFFVIGAVTGWLGDQKSRERERAERVNSELQAAYAELRQTIEQLLQAERLSSLAEIASGVVHEVRNPLGAIKGAVEIIEDGLAIDSPRREFAHIAKTEVERIDKLVQEFLRFARPPELAKSIADLNELVETVARLVEQQAAAQHVTVSSVSTSELPPVAFDGEQIKQVLLNLAINALQAMPDGGKLVFRTLAVNNGAAIEVEDTGGGIPAYILERIFDPFFTTKDKGSGLGLSVARKIVGQHEGSLVAENTSEGAIFRLTLNRHLLQGSATASTAVE